ncbi:hypothetical protein LWI28_017284 [Acer negundo]|uniref:Uncharacterized protein n=1 Tax=Acer negundo TaxID=4023 RepID=A0AAD5NPM6_ACENE|nr:hypothetical protein LWI28_017284 [Acer negundo]
MWEKDIVHETLECGRCICESCHYNELVTLDMSSKCGSQDVLLLNMNLMGNLMVVRAFWRQSGRRLEYTPKFYEKLHETLVGLVCSVSGWVMLWLWEASLEANGLISFSRLGLVWFCYKHGLQFGEDWFCFKHGLQFGEDLVESGFVAGENFVNLIANFRIQFPTSIHE